MQEDFSPWVYGYMLVYLAVTISINYWLDFEDSILDSYFGQNIGFLYYFLFHATGYMGVAIPIAFFQKNGNYLLKSEFWVKSLVFLGLIGLTSGFHYHVTHAPAFSEYAEEYFFSKIATEFKRIFICTIPLLLVWKIYDRQHKDIFGLTRQPFDYRPYLLMLLIVLPFITGASFNEGFLRTYPRYKAWQWDGAFDLESWQLGAIYEVVYGFDFIFVEWVYRGALVVGMASVMGRSAVLPMVSAYAFLHFGKPLGETLGSIFGGYILGVIALQTRNVSGGICIHMGVAYLMELTAYLQHVWRE